MPAPTAPLDNLETVVNTARVRLNDAISSLSGEIVTDTAVFTLVAINAAWRRFQETLVNYGYTWLKIESILAGLAAVTNNDPGAQVSINWSGYFDGTGTQAAPVLPQNLIAPLALWERPTGPNPFMPMDRVDNGLPGVPKIGRNKSWEWRNGAIYMPGATSITDVRVRYAAFYSDFVAPSGAGGVPFSQQLVPILRSLNPFAWFICSEAAKARGDLDAESFDQKAQVATKFMFDLDPLQAKSIQNEAEYTKMTDAYTPTDGPMGPRGKQGGGQ